MQASHPRTQILLSPTSASGHSKLYKQLHRHQTHGLQPHSPPYHVSTLVVIYMCLLRELPPLYNWQGSILYSKRRRANSKSSHRHLCTSIIGSHQGSKGSPKTKSREHHQERAHTRRQIRNRQGLTCALNTQLRPRSARLQDPTNRRRHPHLTHHHLSATKGHRIQSLADAADKIPGLAIARPVRRMKVGDRVWRERPKVAEIRRILKHATLHRIIRPGRIIEK